MLKVQQCHVLYRKKHQEDYSLTLQIHTHIVHGLNKSAFLSGMNTLIGYDLVPEPKILDSALRACRRLNDLASAIRILEAVRVGVLCCLHMLFYTPLKVHVLIKMWLPQ